MCILYLPQCPVNSVLTDLFSFINVSFIVCRILLNNTTDLLLRNGNRGHKKNVSPPIFTVVCSFSGNNIVLIESFDPQLIVALAGNLKIVLLNYNLQKFTYLYTAVNHFPNGIFYCVLRDGVLV